MKKIMKWVAIILVIAVIGYLGYSHFFAKQVTYVYRTQPVSRGDITATINATGKVNAEEMVEVGTQVSGTIKEIYVDYNSPVEKGQLLALLDTDSLESKVEESKASLSSAQASVTRAQADLTKAQRDHQRNVELLNRKLIAKSEMEGTENTLKVARASLVEAQAKVVQVQASLNQAEINLGYARITSPIDGVVVDRQVDVGQTVAASFSTPTLFYIAKDLTQMQIEANIDEADIGTIQVGQKAIATFDAWQKDTFEATVSQVRLNPETVSNVVTYVVILKINNPDGKLMPGMTANLNIITAKREDVVRVPSSALRFTPPEDAVTALMGTAGSSGRQGTPPDRSSSGGLVSMPSRPQSSSVQVNDGRTLWIVEDGKLARRVTLENIGITDRTWVEVTGADLEKLNIGDQLGISYTRVEKRAWQ